MRTLDLASLWVPKISPGEVILRAVIMYVFIQILFRFVGRKEFGRWGASDVVLLFLVTTAVRKSIVADDASVTTAMLALTTIVALEWALSLITARSRRAANLLQGPVRQLVRDGTVQRAVMRKTRISEDELLSRIREKGKESLRDVKDAFLERSGKITIVLRDA